MWKKFFFKFSKNCCAPSFIVSQLWGNIYQRGWWNELKTSINTLHASCKQPSFCRSTEAWNVIHCKTLLQKLLTVWSFKFYNSWILVRQQFYFTFFSCSSISNVFKIHCYIIRCNRRCKSSNENARCPRNSANRDHLSKEWFTADQTTDGQIIWKWQNR